MINELSCVLAFALRPPKAKAKEKGRKRREEKKQCKRVPLHATKINNKKGNNLPIS